MLALPEIFLFTCYHQSMLYFTSTVLLLLLIVVPYTHADVTLLCMVLTMPGHEDAATAIAETWGALCVALIQ